MPNVEAPAQTASGWGKQLGMQALCWRSEAAPETTSRCAAQAGADGPDVLGHPRPAVCVQIVFENRAALEEKTCEEKQMLKG